MIEPFPYTPDQKAWLNALETETHEGVPLRQCQKKLFNGVSYCCLGVACLVLGIPHETIGDGRFTFDHQAASLPAKAVSRLQLRGPHGEHENPVLAAGQALSSLNDVGRLTFPEIAGRILAKPRDYFTNLDER